MNNKVRDMVLCALFAALISISAYLSIPMPTSVPISLQPFFAMLAGAILGSKRGAISMALYMMIGLIGIPVFSGGTGGFGLILSPTFGYIIGFIACAYVTGFIVEQSRKRNFTFGLIIAPFVGVLVDYLVGVPYLFVIFNTVMGNAISPYVALTYGFFPYIALDIVKAGVVAVMALSIVPTLSKQGLLDY